MNFLRGLFGSEKPAKVAAPSPGGAKRPSSSGRTRSASTPQPLVPALAQTEKLSDGSLSGRSPTAAGVDQAEAIKVISRIDDVPSMRDILTIGARARHRLPKDVESTLMAIELGPRRASILFDPDPRKQEMLAQHLPMLRASLIGQNYDVEAAEHPCLATILRKLAADYNSRHGGEAGEVQVQSRAKDLFLNWLEMAAKENATDIHIEINGTTAIVRIRVDGELTPLRDASGGVYLAVEAENAMAYPFNSLGIKGSNSASSWTASKDLYCMTTPRAIGKKMISLRYQSLRGSKGPKVICRLLNTDPNAPTLSYEKLGYAESQRQLLLEVADLPAGFVIFAGVTGSGKTTTLKTFIETHPGNGKMAFYSIEDPVEYPLKGVHQMQIQRDVSDDEGSIRAFLECVKGLMRGDPDCVSIGEIRDRASAAAGQSIVETGHMAMGTVHAHLLTGCVPRLTNHEVGMDRDVLTNPNILSLLAYQALVPRLCPFCKFDAAHALADVRDRMQFHSAHANEENKINEILRLSEKSFKLDREALRFRNYEGCDECNHRGTAGQTVVAEMLIPDREWLQLTRAGKDYEAMVHYRSASDGKYDSEDMRGKTVFQHTLYKASYGLVDPRACQQFSSFQSFELDSHLGNLARQQMPLRAA